MNILQPIFYRTLFYTFCQWSPRAPHYAWGTNGVSECKTGVESTWVLTSHQMDHFVVTWIIFKNHLLKIGLTQNRETMALWTLITVDFILFYHAWGPAWIEIHRNSILLRAQSHMTSHYTRGSVTTLHDFGGVLGRPLNPFVWALLISWSRLSACVWSGP
jgi:hypothetical protein